MDKITRTGYLEIVNAYQTTKDQLYIGSMVDYLRTPITQQTHKNLRRVSAFGYTYDDVYSIGLEVLWLCMEEYDGSRGADFLAFFAQRYRWLVNDKMIEKKGSLADDQYFNSISLDYYSISDENGSMDSLEMEVGGELDLSSNDSSILMVEYLNTFYPLLTVYKTRAEGFNEQMSQAILNDVEIIALTMEAVANNQTSKTELNTFLYNSLPEVNRSTVRLRKKNAFKRFGKFLKENM